MFKLCWKDFAQPRKSYPKGLLFIHKNGWFGLMSVTERSYGPVPISKAEGPVADGGCVGGGGGAGREGLVAKVQPYMSHLGIPL